MFMAFFPNNVDDEKIDTYSFGLVLLAMAVDGDLVNFLCERWRQHKNKKPRVTKVIRQMRDEGWRPVEVLYTKEMERRKSKRGGGGGGGAGRGGGGGGGGGGGVESQSGEEGGIELGNFLMGEAASSMMGKVFGTAASSTPDEREEEKAEEEPDTATAEKAFTSCPPERASDRLDEVVTTLPHAPKSIVMLIVRCIAESPSKRPSFAEILAELEGPVKEEVRRGRPKSSSSSSNSSSSNSQGRGMALASVAEGEEDPAALLQEHDVARWTRRSTTTAGDGTGSREGRSVRPQAGDEEGEGEDAFL
jgi:serine/threonine protein kinase